MSLAHLKPLILEILNEPDVDLASISAKRVRKVLSEKDPTLDVKEHKAAIDQIIVEAFNEIAPQDEEQPPAPSSPPKPAPAPAPVAAPAPAPAVARSNGAPKAAPKRKRSPSAEEEPDEDEDDEDDEIPESSPAFAMASKPKSAPKVKAEVKPLTDEEMARQLHEQLNAPGRSTRRGTTYGKAGRSGGGKGLKKTKSTQYVEDSDLEDEDGEEAGGAYKAPKKRAKRDPSKPATGGFHKTFSLSAELAAVVGGDKMSRPQVIKALWAYIKEHELQDPSDKRKIICDDKLQALFGVARTNGFKMNKPLQKHFYELEVDDADLVDEEDLVDDEDEAEAAPEAATEAAAEAATED